MRKCQTFLVPHYGSVGIPSNYLSVDVETTGLKPDWDLIVEIGHCAVHAGKGVGTMSTLIDWTKNEYVDQDWLKAKLSLVRRHVEGDPHRPTGRTFPITYERLGDEGILPEVAFRFYRDLFEFIRAGKGLFVMHNGLQCDVPFLEAAFEEWLQDPFIFAPYEVFDTGAMVKAAQLELYPNKNETLRDYFLRVVRKRVSGVYWSLEGYCLEAFELDKKYDLRREDLHTAGVDALMTHWLLEELRLADGNFSVAAGTEKRKKVK